MALSQPRASWQRCRHAPDETRTLMCTQPQRYRGHFSVLKRAHQVAHTRPHALSAESRGAMEREAHARNRYRHAAHSVAHKDEQHSRA